MTREEAIKELEEDKALYMPEEWIESLDRDTPDGRLITALDMAIEALEQELCEDEYIKVPKKALKYRTAEMVAYNIEWLKKHFDMERAIIFGAQV